MNSEVLITHTKGPLRRSPHQSKDQLQFVLHQVDLSTSDYVAATLCQSETSTTLDEAFITEATSKCHLDATEQSLKARLLLSVFKYVVVLCRGTAELKFFIKKQKI